MSTRHTVLQPLRLSRLWARFDFTGLVSGLGVSQEKAFLIARDDDAPTSRAITSCFMYTIKGADSVVCKQLHDTPCLHFSMKQGYEQRASRTSAFSQTNRYKCELSLSIGFPD
jgi:hypothetical protein